MQEETPLAPAQTITSVILLPQNCLHSALDRRGRAAYCSLSLVLWAGGTQQARRGQGAFPPQKRLGHGRRGRRGGSSWERRDRARPRGPEPHLDVGLPAQTPWPADHATGLKSGKKIWPGNGAT